MEEEQPEFIQFTPNVFSRIAPDIYLERILKEGIRPNLRKYEEFRSVQVNNKGFGRYDESNPTKSSVLGSSVVKVGKTTVLCAITGGIVSDDDILDQATTSSNPFATVYPLVEIARGRSGACTDEEMIIAQKLYETLKSSGIIRKSALKIRYGYKRRTSDDKVEVIFPHNGPQPDGANDDNDQVMTDGNTAETIPFQDKQYSFVLYANLQVFSRTGPPFDICWTALIKALKNTKLPYTFLDEDTTSSRTVKSRSGANATIERSQLICDPVLNYPIKLEEKKIGYSSTFGLVTILDGEKSQEILLADIEGESEESASTSLVHVVVTGDKLTSLTIHGGSKAGGNGSRITKDFIKKSIDLAHQRSLHLSSI
ncbi:hypothetical protein LJB42_002688 [Komagataella kurtzmanii]|nr:hypothetical protein LJB42_002688 [Komagataella kurtzmanii]